MRASGVLMHISSLPSPYGIGSLGKEAYKFVDFLREGGQTYWQILPIGPTSYGDSPYQSFSSYAGNPYFIDLDMLAEDGYLQKSDYDTMDWGSREDDIDYALLYKKRYLVLRRALNPFFENIPEGYSQFVSTHAHWLEDYALFMTVKSLNGDVTWTKWSDELRKKEENTVEKIKQNHGDEIGFWKMLQFFFYRQWFRLKSYANKKNVAIIGDMPIYISMDSSDVWMNPELFLLDKNFMPIETAGCPPDSFSPDGQLWGNPLFRWDVMKEDGYLWWTNRLRHTTSIFDITRIDHFRGFDSYYTIPYGEETAKKGTWVKGPGLDFFRTIEKELDSPRFIAEDLGFITPSVIKLVEDTGYPSMKVLQFAFDSRDDSDYLPHNYNKNCVVYTGTHDNSTIMGWFAEAVKSDTDFAVDYLRLTKEEGYHWGMMKSALASVSDTVILTMQDLLGLDNCARMNIPSTLGCNWRWRAHKNDINEKVSQKLHEHSKTYRRIPLEDTELL